jgi:hypothetical protein
VGYVSLLRKPPHTVLVQPHKAIDGRYGQDWVPDGEPVEVECAVQPLSADEAERLGVQANTTMRIICRRWPYGPHTLITYNGREYEQVGEARQYRMSRRTAHDDVIIRAVGAHG